MGIYPIGTGYTILLDKSKLSGLHIDPLCLLVRSIYHNYM